MAQMVIVNDSCSNEVGVTFWQAPNDYNVGMYVVTLLREGEQTCPSQICDKEVFHVSDLSCTHPFYFGGCSGVDLSRLQCP